MHRRQAVILSKCDERKSKVIALHIIGWVSFCSMRSNSETDLVLRYLHFSLPPNVHIREQ